MSEEKRACLWMIRHYLDRAMECREEYSSLVDFYTVYDHYMIAVQYWEGKLEDIYNKEAN
jgi:hypothetical protein